MRKTIVLILVLGILLLSGLKTEVLAYCAPGCTESVTNEYYCEGTGCDHSGIHQTCDWNSCHQNSVVHCDCPTYEYEKECGSGYYACGTGCCPVGKPPDVTNVPAGPPGPGGDLPVCNASCNFTYCGIVPNDCNAPCPCKECHTCTPACGQKIDCKTCATTDALAPGIPTLVSPKGTSASPAKVTVTQVPLSWNAVATAEKYEIDVFDAATNSLVWSQTVTGTSVTTGALARSKIYFWRARAVNTTCTSWVGEKPGTWSANTYFKIGTGPTFTSLVVKTSDGQTVNIDSLDRLQNCQEEIISSSRPGELRFTATISDPDGWSDISAISLRWGTSGSGTAMTLAPGSGNVRTANLTVDLSTWSYATTTKPLQVIATDSFGLTTNWISSHKLKYWNCKLPVSGTIYDAAGGGQVCATGAGFLTPVTTKFNFQGIGYTEVSPKISSVPMLATLPATYTSSGGNDLLWGRDYQPKFNKDIQGTSQLIRMIDRGDAGVTGVSCFATNQITLIDGKVNPYSTNPRVQIDYSFITNQEPWFQVAGAGVLAANRLETNVPVTCPLIAGCKPATAINSTSASGGILSAIEVETNSGCSLSGPCRYGETNNWVKESVILSAEDRPTYRTIYNQYLANKGVGVTIEGNTTMSTITAKSSGVGGTGVVFVNGNLSVNVGNTVPVGKFLMIVVKGGITFEKNVTKNEGIFMADGGIRTVGLSNNQLVINGVLYSGINAPTGNIRFIRGFTDKSDNNGQPATVVNYRPDLIFNMPGKVSQVLTGWKTAL